MATADLRGVLGDQVLDSYMDRSTPVIDPDFDDGDWFRQVAALLGLHGHSYRDIVWSSGYLLDSRGSWPKIIAVTDTDIHLAAFPSFQGASVPELMSVSFGIVSDYKIDTSGDQGAFVAKVLHVPDQDPIILQLALPPPPRSDAVVDRLRENCELAKTTGRLTLRFERS